MLISKIMYEIAQIFQKKMINFQSFVNKLFQIDYLGNKINRFYISRMEELKNETKKVNIHENEKKLGLDMNFINILNEENKE